MAIDRTKLLFFIAGVGFACGVAGAWLAAERHPAQKPVFTPAANPFAQGIYATGMVESYQDNGANINLYPEVSGTVVAIPVKEGQRVTRGETLLQLDASVQAALAAQQQAQAEAARATLDELKAQPRPENLKVAAAQVAQAEAGLKTVQDQLDKLQRSFAVEPRSISREAMDDAVNAVRNAQAGLEVARRQYELTRAGAWAYDVRSEERQYAALSKAYAASAALLEKYTVRAPVDGVVLSIGASVGSYLTPQGVYATYTQGMAPAVVMGGGSERLAVRCYVDEILVQRLPAAARIKARMTIRGTDVSVPLQFVRVLPVLFSFVPPAGREIYLGQQVDVYIGTE